MEDEGKILMTLAEATAITSGMQLLINKLEATDHDINDEVFKMTLSFFHEIHWKYYKISTSRKVTKDIFGRFHLKDDDQRKNLNIN